MCLSPGHHEYKYVNFSHTGVEAFVVTLNSSSWAHPCWLVQLKGCHTQTHIHIIHILKTCTHSIQHSSHLPSRCPQRKNCTRTATDGATPLRPLSQAKLHRTAHSSSTSEACRPPLFLWGKPFLRGLFLLCHSSCVYGFIAALPKANQHQQHTALP